VQNGLVFIQETLPNLPLLTTSLFPIPSSLIYTHLPHHSYAARNPGPCVDVYVLTC
jgi:hypothetical protein